MSPDASTGVKTEASTLDAHEQHGYFLEDLSVGMTAVHGKTVTDADILLFTGVSGDTNPLHLDHDFASRTMFGGPIVHGMLTASLISTVVGTRLPGPGCIYLSQNLRFRAPVRISDTVKTRATILEVIAEKRRIRLETVCKVGDTVVLDGEALVMVPTRAATAAE